MPFSTHPNPDIGVQCVVGCLVEIHLHVQDVPRPILDAFLKDLQRSVERALQTSRGRIVVCADLRGVNVVAPHLADFMTEVMRRDNPHLERSANLLTPNAMFGLQLERVMRNSVNPSRRRFDSLEMMLDWLHECLLPEEFSRARRFLSIFKPEGT